jgi:UDP-N-acetyl-alpha-D-muramoyl-L-alanyl-L-glutamate epimerase
VTKPFVPQAYRSFRIDGYDVVDGVFSGRYTMRGADAADDVTFTETVEFGPSLAGGRPDDRLLRLLTLTCSLSYYKAAAPPQIEIAFPTYDFERDYLRQLITGGLGEYAYRNNLPGALSPEIVSDNAAAPAPAPDSWDPDAPPLVPVGGGKDSVVSIETLAPMQPVLFNVNKFDPIDRCIEISGLQHVRVMRAIDRTLIEANAAGAHNGHIPVTAINSIIGLIVADANGLGPVVLSNERSSNVGNVEWMGQDINHQWSKSVIYETLLRDTLSSYGLNPDRYFSLLRGLSESQIADRFAASPQYFRAFISCNRPFALDAGRRGATWCGHCPKCQFVFVLMAPRLGRAEVEAIFGRNLFDDTENRAGFEDILGIGAHKPFECVGEYYEAAESMLSILDDEAWTGLPLVEEFRSARAELVRVADDHDNSPAVQYVPARYRAALDRLDTNIDEGIGRR